MMPRGNFAIHLAWHFQVSTFRWFSAFLTFSFAIQYSPPISLSRSIYYQLLDAMGPLSFSLSPSPFFQQRNIDTNEREVRKQRREEEEEKKLHPNTLIFFQESGERSLHSTSTTLSEYPHWWMGNCISFRRVVSWVDDGEWDFLEDEIPEYCPQQPRFQDHVQKHATSTESTNNDDDRQPAEVLPTEAAKSMTHEVRIKITKKQLAELLRQAESKGLPVQDVLATLVETRKPRGVKHTIGQCWRPALQSIPEIAE